MLFNDLVLTVVTLVSKEKFDSLILRCFFFLLIVLIVILEDFGVLWLSPVDCGVWKCKSDFLGQNHLQHLQRAEQQSRQGRQHLIQNSTRKMIKIIETKYESMEVVVLIESGLTKSICPGT